jgi:hypothetical protein
MDRTAVMLWVGSGALLLGVVDLFKFVDRVRYVWSGTIHGLSVGCVWRTPAGCTLIRITMTLGYE